MTFSRDGDRPVSARTRAAACFAEGLAHLVARLPPRRIRMLLRVLGKGARPARNDEVAHVRTCLLSTRIRLRGVEACLPRSLAVVLLSRMRGAQATWCVGVLRSPPFLAHAWVEADGEMVGEHLDSMQFVRLLAAGPSARGPHRPDSPEESNAPGGQALAGTARYRPAAASGGNSSGGGEINGQAL
ncbi:lasso peptide biosynthesis B2 protein [Nonomuraea sp. NPDC050451]|uniref:lasso peptide biosynthesis B2 protein n=1 Tax=Nonomuraea sp. NPDC050451 TaxID=3364364 RepID=UPI00379F5F2D